MKDHVGAHAPVQALIHALLLNSIRSTHFSSRLPPCHSSGAFLDEGPRAIAHFSVSVAVSTSFLPLESALSSNVRLGYRLRSSANM